MVWWCFVRCNMTMKRSGAFDFLSTFYGAFSELDTRAFFFFSHGLSLGVSIGGCTFGQNGL